MTPGWPPQPGDTWTAGPDGWFARAGDGVRMLPVVGGTPSLSVEEWQAEAPAPLLLAHRLYWGDGSLTAGSVRDAERARMHLALLIQLLTANPSPGRGVVETATLLIDCTVSHIRDALNGLPAPARVAVGADPSP